MTKYHLIMPISRHHEEITRCFSTQFGTGGWKSGNITSGMIDVLEDNLRHGIISKTALAAQPKRAVQRVERICGPKERKVRAAANVVAFPALVLVGAGLLSVGAIATFGGSIIVEGIFLASCAAGGASAMGAYIIRHLNITEIRENMISLRDDLTREGVDLNKFFTEARRVQQINDNADVIFGSMMNTLLKSGTDRVSRDTLGVLEVQAREIIVSIKEALGSENFRKVGDNTLILIGEIIATKIPTLGRKGTSRKRIIVQDFPVDQAATIVDELCEAIDAVAMERRKSEQGAVEVSKPSEEQSNGKYSVAETPAYVAKGEEPAGGEMSKHQGESSSTHVKNHEERATAKKGKHVSFADNIEIFSIPARQGKAGGKRFSSPSSRFN